MTGPSNRQWRMLRYPEGTAFADALALEEAPLADPQDGEVVVHNRWLSLDAGTRLWMTPRTDGYQPPLPLGAIVPGQVLGHVIQSRHPGFREGDLVRGFGQWADYSTVCPETSGLMAVDPALKDVREHLGALGMNGWTALVGVSEVGRAKAGETVLVSAAAGATGLLALQIAKILDCRTAGIVGGAAKCRYLTETVGADIAIDRRAPDIADRLAELGGIDVYFDNVGGPLIDAVLPAMAHYGRIALCGLVASYEGGAGPAVTRFDQILMRRLRVTGFFSPDFANRGAELTQQLRGWVEAGRLTLPFDETIGLERTLDAYRRLFTGGNIGKVIVSLG